MSSVEVEGIQEGSTAEEYVIKLLMVCNQHLCQEMQN